MGQRSQDTAEDAACLHFHGAVLAWNVEWDGITRDTNHVGVEFFFGGQIYEPGVATGSARIYRYCCMTTRMC